MARNGAPDWPSIRSAYEGDGSRSIRSIAKQAGVSHVAIHKRATAEGWKRADGDGGRKGVNFVVPPVPMPRASAPSPSRNEPEDILTRARREAETLLSELEETRLRMGEIEDAIEDETRNDMNGRRRAMMMKAVSLPTRSAVLKTIMQALATMREAEPGKKEMKAEAAKEAARGKFAAPAPPMLAVDNTKK